MCVKKYLNNLNKIPKTIPKTISKTIRLLGFIWALPLTALGLIVWLMRRWQDSKAAYCQDTATGWVFVATGGVVATCLQRHPFAPMSAMALGCCVIAQDKPTLAQCWQHELVHVQQARQWGLLFPAAYGLCSLWAWAKGGCIYADNYFERQAG